MVRKESAGSLETAMINVLFVESGRTGGGSFESLYQHLKVIDRDRIQPTVVALNHTRYTQLIQDLGVPLHVPTDTYLSLHAPQLPRKVAIKLKGAALRLNRLIPSAHIGVLRLVHRHLVDELACIVRDAAIDIVHLNVQIYRDFFGLFLTERTGVLSISHLRSANPGTRGQFNPKMAAIGNRYVGAFVANSRMTAEYWWEHGIDPAKTRLIPNGVPSYGGPPVDVRKTWNLNSGASPLLGCVVPMRLRLKVDEFLIRGFARFLRKWPSAMLLVVGDGPVRPILEQEAAALGVKGNIVFTGHQNNAVGILAGLDVSLEMQTMDSFSRVALETMQAGTPLVANDLGGIRELVQHGENGLLIEYGDEESFADTVESVLMDKDLRSKLVENGYKTISERFSIERYASDMEGVYVDLVGEK